MSHATLQSAELTLRALNAAAAHLAEAHRAAGPDIGLVKDIETMRRKMVQARARAHHVVQELSRPAGELAL